MGVSTGTGTGAGMGAGMSPATGMSYVATNLVSDLSGVNNPYGTASTDPHLVKGRGVAFNPTGFAWVTSNGTSTSTLYDGNGTPQSLVVAIPPGAAGSAAPTGIVFNGHQDFMVTLNGMSGASAFIFAGEAGTLSGWSPTVDMTHAVMVFDGGSAGTVYKGLALASTGTSDLLYAADFRHANVDVFDANFTKVDVAGGFIDQALPAGYAPFGLQAIGGLIYVSYARQDTSARNEVAGAGLGAVDAFDTAGHLVKRLVPVGGALNAPWGMAMAPANFGAFSNALLVANVGDGKIHAFNPATGALMGTLSMMDGNPIVIDGLRGIAFGNGIDNQPANTLFFAAGPGGGAHGVYGRIDSR
ncbi:TIGR03118 family protein [Variovorax sp. M-6]|uniref:TIGR03118 family protein n=1 Tax=Variovorax sp. M-6 TaxID=3233041 RepID=UPI003F9B9A25